MEKLLYPSEVFFIIMKTNHHLKGVKVGRSLSHERETKGVLAALALLSDDFF